MRCRPTTPTCATICGVCSPSMRTHRRARLGRSRRAGCGRASSAQRPRSATTIRLASASTSARTLLLGLIGAGGMGAVYRAGPKIQRFTAPRGAEGDAPGHDVAGDARWLRARAPDSCRPRTSEHRHAVRRRRTPEGQPYYTMEYGRRAYHRLLPRAQSAAGTTRGVAYRHSHGAVARAPSLVV